MSRLVCVQRTGRRTEIAYKAESLGKAAQHNKAQGSGDRVNVLIRGGLSAMRDVAFLVRLPEGATGIQRSRHLLEGIGPVFQYIHAFSLAGHQAR